MIAVKFFASSNRAALLRPAIIAAAVAAICLIVLNISDGPKSVPASSGESALEARLEAVLTSIDGVGKTSVLINGDEGVLIVAQGGDDIEVRLEIIRAVKALLGVSVDRIEVLTMGG